MKPDPSTPTTLDLFAGRSYAPEGKFIETISAAHRALDKQQTAAPAANQEGS